MQDTSDLLKLAIIINQDSIDKNQENPVVTHTISKSELSASDESFLGTVMW